ncbi:MoxR family ATPase, partial [Streptomyces goshikiensis]
MTEYEQEQDAPAVDAAGADGTAWRVFHATGAAPAGAPPAIPPAPPWREFAGQPRQPAPPHDRRAERPPPGAPDPPPTQRDPH